MNEPANELLTAADAATEEHLTRALSQLRPAVVPLFSHKRKRPEIIGTGVAVRAGDARLLFTAAHVIRDFADDTIVVASNQEWAILEGTAHFASTPDHKDAQDDRIDAAILELSPESAGNLSAWLSPSQLLPGAPTAPSERYLLVGFPRSKLKYDFSTMSITPRTFRYHSGPATNHEAVRLGVRAETHIVLPFNREKVRREGQQLTAPSVRGVSGGLLAWTPGIFRADAPERTGVAGIFIEWPSPERFLISTRIDVHLALVHEKLPHLSSVFPKPVSIRRKP